MEDILTDIGAVLGVTGCFVCDAEGQILASTLPDLLDEGDLSTVSRTISQTTAGLVTARRRKVQEIDLLYSEGRLVVKPLRDGCLCVVCTRNMNVPLLNLTVDVAARKLTEALKQEKEPPPAPEPEGVPLEEVLHTVVDAYPDVVSPVMDFEQTLAENDRRTALNNLGRRAGEMIYQRRYSSMRVPASIPQGIELAVGPAVSPFAIVSSQGNRLDVLACPFCRNLPSPSVRCHFLAGFIQGLLNSIAGLEEVVVTESLCRARGEDTCSFEALAQQS